MSLPATDTEPEKNIESKQPSWPLIGPGDPPPFSVINEDGKAPFLLVCDHASPRFPKAMNHLGVADWVLDKHVACDIGAEQVTRHLSERFDAPAVIAGYSRLIVDLNRQLHDGSAFISVSDGIAIPGNLNISDEEIELRTQTFFNPYHEAIQAQLKRFSDRGHVPALLSIHTCTPVFDQVVRRMHIGIMWDRDPRIAQPLIRALDNMEGVCVGDNEPYSGQHPNDYTIDEHAENEGLPCVGVEIRQDLVSDQAGAVHWADVLGDGLEEILADDNLYQLRSS